ncbi:SPL1 [Scenedesmus sp. PABB004]|nr:SPL1 [Scenedesmus sp. PABB004]
MPDAVRESAGEGEIDFTMPQSTSTSSSSGQQQPSSSSAGRSTDSAGGRSSAGGASKSSSSKQSSKLCRAVGCCVDLTALSNPYCVKKNVCPEHLKAEAMQIKGGGDKLWRFCQQCGKLEPLVRFAGDKRSCRSSLQRRRENVSRLKAARADGSYRSSHFSHRGAATAGAGGFYGMLPGAFWAMAAPGAAAAAMHGGAAPDALWELHAAHAHAHAAAAAAAAAQHGGLAQQQLLGLGAACAPGGAAVSGPLPAASAPGSALTGSPELSSHPSGSVVGLDDDNLLDALLEHEIGSAMALLGQPSALDGGARSASAGPPLAAAPRPRAAPARRACPEAAWGAAVAAPPAAGALAIEGAEGQQSRYNSLMAQAAEVQAMLGELQGMIEQEGAQGPAPTAWHPHAGAFAC